MWLGEVAFARDVEQVLDAVEVEEERVTAGTGEERDVSGPGDVGLRPDETSTPEKIFFPTASTSRASSPVAMNTSTVWLPSFGSENT